MALRRTGSGIRPRTPGISRGRRGGLEAGQVGVRSLHPRRPPQRSGPGRGGRRGVAAALRRCGVGQVPAIVAASGERHVPGSGARAVGRVGVGPRRLVGLDGNLEPARQPGRLWAATRARASIRAARLTQACPDWGAGSRQAAAALRGVGRASGLVECVKSVRMTAGAHRGMTRGLLGLKRLYWDLRGFRTGRREGRTPYGPLGL